MGLDMYLTGNKYIWTDWKEPENNRTEDGFRVKSVDLELGYWRKHPDLHGFIVKTFAEGVDECQDIDLDDENLQTIIAAVESGSLPATTGFFFGSSAGRSDEDKKADVAVLQRAREWLAAKDKASSKSVIYRASW